METPQQKYARVHKDELKLYRKQWRDSHKESTKEYLKSYYIENKEKILKRVSDRYYEHHINEVPSCEFNLEFVLNEQRNLRKVKQAYKRAGGGDFSLKDWYSLLEEFDYKCAYCKERTNHLSPDHVIPLSRGGENTLNNILPACTTCNTSKNKKLLEEWIPNLNDKMNEYFDAHPIICEET
jgi:5-methylcytosine-specific restriction endonuclease McrA